MITRRGLLGGIFAAGFAPAAIGSGVLMPVRRIWQPAAFLGIDLGAPVGLGWYIFSTECMRDGSLVVWWDNKTLPKHVPGLRAALPFKQTTEVGAAIVDREKQTADLFRWSNGRNSSAYQGRHSYICLS